MVVRAPGVPTYIQFCSRCSVVVGGVWLACVTYLVWTDGERCRRGRGATVWVYARVVLSCGVWDRCDEFVGRERAWPRNNIFLVVVDGGMRQLVFAVRRGIFFWCSFAVRSNPSASGLGREWSRCRGFRWENGCVGGRPSSAARFVQRSAVKWVCG